MLLSSDPEPERGEGPDGFGVPHAMLDAHAVEEAANAAFAAALLDPERAAPAGLTGPNGKRAVKRFAAYRNNVVVGLVDALASTYPAVQRIVGEPFFRAAARLHALTSPPTSPLIAEYGRGFPDFLAAFEHARSMPYLPDVARIERAWLDSYHAADAAPLDPAALGTVPPERLGEVRLVPHPAMRVVRSPFAAVSATALNRSTGEVPRIDVSVAEDGLIVRPALEVSLTALPPGGAAFILALSDGRPLGEAAALATADHPDFDLAANIGGILAAGAFTGLTLDPLPDAPARQTSDLGATP